MRAHLYASLANLEKIPAAWALIRGRLPFWQKACHDKYGPVVRIAPNGPYPSRDVLYAETY